MLIKVLIKHPDITLKLVDGIKEIDKIEWQDSNDMSKKLLPAIDTLIKRNKIVVADLEKIEVDSDQQSYTSTRIAQTVAKTVGYCLT